MTSASATFLNLLPAQVLLGLRDATSAALGVSVTFTDADGKPIAIEPFHVGRRFTVRACQLFHCRYNSPVKTQICDQWDRTAATAVVATGEMFDHTCGLGYSGVAVPILVHGQIDGLLLAGERRLSSRTTEQNDTDYEHARDILALTDPKRLAEHKHEWNKACADPYTLTELEWAGIRESLLEVAQFIGALVDAFREHKTDFLWSSKVVDLVTNSRELRLVTAAAVDRLAPNTRQNVLAILAAGFPASNQWLWEFHDPEVLDPAHSARMERLSFVLFADIRGFSEACEDDGTDAVERARREILTSAIDLIKHYGGIVDKFIGDAVLAYFFGPTVAGVQAHHEPGEGALVARRAAECALAIQELSATSGEHTLRFGVGISYGRLLFGQFTFEGRNAVRREITGIGSVVNKAQRISSLARKRTALNLRPAVLIDEDARQKIKETYDCPREDVVRLKGFGLVNYEPIYSIRGATIDDDRDAVSPPRQRVVNLSQGSLSVPPSHVIDAFQDYYEWLKHTKAQLPLGDPQISLPSALASVLGCNETSIGFRSSTTECIDDALTNYRDHYRLHRDPSKPHVSRSMVVMTDLEHPTVAASAIQRFQKVRIIQLNDHHKQLKAKTIQRVFEREFRSILAAVPPAAVLFPHISWSTGVLFPIHEIATFIRSVCAEANVRQPLVIIDGAHALGHVPLKLALRETLQPAFDVYATSAHKWLRGPHGIGVMYVSPRVVDCRQCRQRYASGDVFTCTAGLGGSYLGEQSRTHDRAKAYACLAAVNYQVRGQHPSVWASDRFVRIREMRRKLWRALAASCKVRLADPQPAAESETGILSFLMPKRSALEHQRLQQALEDEGVIVDTLGDGPGLRCCLHPDLLDDDLDFATEVLCRTLRTE